MMVLIAEDFINFLLHVQKKNGYDEVIVQCKNGSAAGTFKKVGTIAKDKIDLDSFRPAVPAKYLFYFPRAKVYPQKTSFPKRIIAGLKACDIKALELLDKALLNSGFTDPDYAGWRENTTVISSDCGDITDFCGCNLFGGKPYPENGFDLNISRLKDKYYITVGSVKGEELIQILDKETELKDVNKSDKDELQKKRDTILSRLEEQNSAYKFNGDFSYLRNAETEKWMNESKECIGCGACTNICPTCYCLILNDYSHLNNFVKIRSTDSCQWHGYARVAGGGTPRPKMHQRFRNRYLCKLDYMEKNFGMSGCTGCGRCTEACAAGINFKKAVSELIAGTEIKELLPEINL